MSEVRVGEILEALAGFAPLALQESYDNSGLLVGDPQAPVRGVLVCLDVSPTVVEEALDLGCNLIVSHHPLIFGGIKRLVPGGRVSDLVLRLVREEIALISFHTNLDSTYAGVSYALGELLGLTGMEVLAPVGDSCQKLVYFVPQGEGQDLRAQLHALGAGVIGEYSQCAFSSPGEGAFFAPDNSSPHTGSRGIRNTVPEERVEMIYPTHLRPEVERALRAYHPYEEPAYDIYPLLNADRRFGLGVVGNLPHPVAEEEFLRLVKVTTGAPVLRHSALRGGEISRVAVCGGSGAGLMAQAGQHRADVLVTADAKYHQFQLDTTAPRLVDAGHFETEHHAKNLLCGIIRNKFTTFAVHISGCEVNPVNYYI